MTINWNWRYLAAFAALLFVMGELHEQAHTTVGYLIGGCYGPRDFNAWGVCTATKESGLSWLATLTGPVLTFALVWLAAIKLRVANSPGAKAAWFSLLFANLPFARIFTAATGGGDEFLVLRRLFLTDGNLYFLWAIAFVLVTLILFWPLREGWRVLPVDRRKRQFLGFLILPMFFAGLVLMAGLNNLLDAGVLADPALLGAPMLINIWLLINLVALGVLRKDLQTLFIEKEVAAK